MIITKLSVILLLEILSYLPIGDLRNMATVSKQFLKLCELVLARAPDRLLDLSHAWKTTGTTFVVPTGASYVTTFKKVSLRYCTKYFSFRFLLNFKALRVLDLFGTNVKDSDLLVLSERIHLHAVDLGFCNELTSHGLCRFLQSQPSLTAIGLASGGAVHCNAVNKEVTQLYSILSKSLFPSL